MVNFGCLVVVRGIFVFVFFIWVVIFSSYGCDMSIMRGEVRRGGR